MAINGAAVRLTPLWKQIQERLTTPDTITILAGGRVYRASEDYSAPAGPENKPWGRQVIIPSEFLWPTAELADTHRGVNFLVRSEMNDFTAPGYDVAIPLEKLQEIAYVQLHEWEPPATGGTRVTLALYRQRPPQPMPEWDQDRQLWWLSSEFRCEAARS